MAELALVDGCRYDLSSQGNYTGHKSYLFVKLTDSALRALDEHSKTGNRSAINFQCNEGTINLQDGGQFQFSLSAAHEQQGSFECLQQLDSSRLELLGSLQYRLRVQANDDLYETTRQRVADAEQASKKNCTRVLKQSSQQSSRPGFKRAGSGASVRSTTSSQPPPSAPAVRSSTSTQPPPSAPAIRQAGGLRRSTAPPRPRPPPARKSAPPAAPPPARGPPQQQLPPPSHPKPDRTAAAAAGSQPAASRPPSSDLLKRPLRERIAHMLATRPYKRIEVVQKLYKDGIRESDKKNVHALLSSVASLRDNVYHLKRHLWCELSADWPFYTPQERQQFISQRPPSPTSDRSPPSSQPSPSSAAAASPPAPVAAAARRRPVGGVPSSAAAASPPAPVAAAARRRPVGGVPSPAAATSPPAPVAAAVRKRPVVPSPVADASAPATVAAAARKRPAGGAPSPAVAASPPAPVAAAVRKRPSAGVPSPAAAPATRKRPAVQSLSGSAAAVKRRAPSPAAAAVGGGWLPWTGAAGQSTAAGGAAGGAGKCAGVGGVQQSPSSTGVSDRTPTPDSSPESQRTCQPGYLADYPTISCHQQMVGYKRDFDRGYQEYQRLWTVMDDVRRKFDCLEQRLRSCDEGSDQWKDIERRIRAEYQACNTEEYRTRRARWLHLQNKLHHIKTLVRQWQADR